MRICTPHCGLDQETTSGGETYERELLRRLGALGVEVHVILARHKRVPTDLANEVAVPIGKIAPNQRLSICEGVAQVSPLS